MSYRIWNFAWVVLLAVMVVSYQNCSQNRRGSSVDSPLDDQVTKLESTSDIDDLSILTDVQSFVADEPEANDLRSRIDLCRAVTDGAARAECVWDMLVAFYEFLKVKKGWTTTLVNNNCLVGVSQISTSTNVTVQMLSSCRAREAGGLAPHGVNVNSCVMRSTGQETAVFAHRRGLIFQHVRAAFKYTEAGQFRIELLSSHHDSPEMTDACGKRIHADRHDTPIVLTVL